LEAAILSSSLASLIALLLFTVAVIASVRVTYFVLSCAETMVVLLLNKIIAAATVLINLFFYVTT